MRKTLQRVLILFYMIKLNIMNIAHNGRAIASAIGMLLRNILEPSSGGTGSMLKDPAPH